MKLGHLDVPSDVCRVIGDTLGRIGDKWAVFIIITLKDGSLRFGDLKKESALYPRRCSPLP